MTDNRFRAGSIQSGFPTRPRPILKALHTIVASVALMAGLCLCCADVTLASPTWAIGSYVAGIILFWAGGRSLAQQLPKA